VRISSGMSVLAQRAKSQRSKMKTGRRLSIGLPP
jgi:hypothetical protein